MPNSGAGELEYKTAATLAGGAGPAGALVAATTDDGPVHVGSDHPFYDLKNDPAGTAWAIVAVTGVRDEVDDIIVPGAFRRSLAEREMKGVKGHDWNRPVAVQRHAVELMPGDDRLPARLPSGAPWPAEAGALAVKASYILGTADGHAAWQEALAFGRSQAYSIGYKVSKARQRGDIRYIYDLDVYEFSPVLHGANKYATLQSVKGGEPWDVETGDLVDDVEGKARGGLRRVVDAAYWGRPVGTVITAGMKPIGPRARAGATDRGGAQRAGQRGVGGGMGQNGTGGVRRDTGAAMRARGGSRAVAGNATVKPDGTRRRQDYSSQRDALAAVTNPAGMSTRRLDDIAEPELVRTAATLERGDQWQRIDPNPEKARELRAYLRERAQREEGLDVADDETPGEARARAESAGDVRTARANLAASRERAQQGRYDSLQNRQRADALDEFEDSTKPIVASDNGRVAAVHRGMKETGTGKNRKAVSQGWLVVDTQTGDILGRGEPDDDVEEFVDAAAETLTQRESRDGRAGGTGAAALRDGVQDDADRSAGGGDRGRSGGGDRRDGGRAGGTGPAGRGVPGEGGEAADRADDRTVGGAAGAAADRGARGAADRAGAGDGDALDGGDTGGDGVRRGDDAVRDGAGEPGPVDAGEDDAGIAPDDVTEDDVPAPDLQAAGRLDAISGEDFVPTSIDDLAPAGVKAKLAANMAAMRMLRALQSENPPRGATAQEQAVLARWAGWGGLPKVFDDAYAEYAAERAELRGLMSQSEWNEARRNTLNAHYTDARATAAVWDAMKELGFDGGRVLEPGSGSGNFIGFAPEGADMVGVELDSTTAGISKYLYPNSTIRNESFAKTRVPDGSFDAAIGNVPFGKFSLHDPVHNKAGASIHNHFIEKSLALTRPGGMVAVLTSRFTMDAQDSSARERMAELGDLVGAVRLPSGSHRRASGTDVIEDILIFRRREEGEPPADQSWVKSKKTDLDGWEIPVNPYWSQHPDRVLGQMEGVKGQYGGDIRVRGDRDMGDLPAALAGIVADAKRRNLTMTERRDPLPELIGPDTARHEGHMQVEADGTVSQASRGAAIKVKVPATQAAEVGALLRLRDDMRALLNAEAASSADTPEIAQARAALNTSYDRYVAKYGPLNRVKVSYNKKNEETRRVPPAVALVRRDPSMAMVRALENYDPSGNGGKGSATKGSIFTKRAAAPRELATTADNGADALALSMDAYGEVRLDEIARMLGTDEAGARDQLRGLVHEIPALTAEEEDLAVAHARAVEAGTATPLTPGGPLPEGMEGLADALAEPGTLVPRAEMLSGNVRRKLAVARAAAAADPRFSAAVEDLQEVVPADLGSGEIEARLGAAWIPPAVVQQFARELLGDRGISVDAIGSGAWVVDGGKKGYTAVEEWGTPAMPFGELLEALLLQKQIKRSSKQADGKYRTDPDLTLAAQAKGEAIQERFAEWIWEDPDRARALQSAYNWSFNSLVLRNYDGVRRTFPGMADGFKPFGHQHAAVERIVNDPTALLAHVVGAGKTAEMVMGAQELKRLGLARKPAIVIPNHMLEQFTREYLEIYPNAKILAAGTDDLQIKKDKDGNIVSAKRTEFVARAAVGDWDAVIMTQEAFAAIPMSPQGRAAYVEREVAEMRAQLDAAKAGGADADDKSVKEMEKAIQSAEAQLEKLLDSKIDEGGVTFEETGIDYLMVDEAHHYSNLRTVTRIPNAGASGSKKATDLHMKLEHLRATTESGRVATFATGTPIRNTMTQTYIMQRFLRPDLLREAGIDSFDQWAATFGETVEEAETSPTGKVRTKTRFSKFRNVPELLRMMHQFADVKMAEDLNLPTPTLRGGRAETVVVAGTPELDEYIQWLDQRADAVRLGVVEPEEDNMLSVSMDGRKAALSMSLVSEPNDAARAAKIMQPHQPGKIEAAADKIHGIWTETKDRVYPLDVKNPDAGDDPNPGSLQIVFLDLGTPNDEGRFDAYDLMRRELAARGMDPKRVRFMHEARNDGEKAQMFADARNGKIDVLIGSTEKMGVGTNVQKRAVALHHLDAPWRPSDVEQREGRIIRQGNANEKLGHDVQILQYVTEGSFDTYMWQTLQRKAKFISQVMRGRVDVREMEDVGDSAMNFGEVKALASGNPELLVQAKVDSLKNKLERLARTHGRAQSNMQRDIGKFTEQADAAESAAAALAAAVERRVDTRGDRFQFTLGDGQSYRDRADAAAALQPELARLRGELRRRWSGPKSEPVGRIGGHTLIAEYRDDRKRGPVLALTLEGVPGDIATLNDSEVDGLGPGVMVRIDNFLNNMDARRASALDRADHLRSEIAKMSGAVGKPFPRARELEAARAKSDRLRRKIALNAARKEAGVTDEMAAELSSDNPLAFDPLTETDVADDPILGRDIASVPGSDVPVETYRPRSRTTPGGGDLGDDAEWDDGLGSVDVDGTIVPPAERAPVAPQTTADADTTAAARADADDALDAGDPVALDDALARLGVPDTDAAPGGADRAELAEALVTLPDAVRERHLDRIETGGTDPAQRQQVVERQAERRAELADTGGPLVTRVNALTALNRRALEETGVARQVAGTYAVFDGAPDEVMARIQEAAAANPEWRNSLAAVLRKLRNREDRFVSVTDAPTDDGRGGTPAPATRSDADDPVSIIDAGGPARQAADRLNMLTSSRERRALIGTLSDEELALTDAEYRRRAEMLGDADHVTGTHQVLQQEIQRRAAAAPTGEQRLDVGTPVLTTELLDAFGGHPDVRPGVVREVHDDGTVTVGWTPSLTSRERVDELRPANSARRGEGGDPATGVVRGEPSPPRSSGGTAAPDDAVITPDELADAAAVGAPAKQAELAELRAQLAAGTLDGRGQMRLQRLEREGRQAALDAEVDDAELNRRLVEVTDRVNRLYRTRKRRPDEYVAASTEKRDLEELATRRAEARRNQPAPEAPAPTTPVGVTPEELDRQERAAAHYVQQNTGLRADNVSAIADPGMPAGGTLYRARVISGGRAYYRYVAFVDGHMADTGTTQREAVNHANDAARRGVSPDPNLPGELARVAGGDPGVEGVGITTSAPDAAPGRSREPYMDKPGATPVPLTDEHATLARYRFEDMLTGDQDQDDELGAYTSPDGRQLLVHDRGQALAEIDTALEILDENLNPPGGRRAGDREDFARWRDEQRRWQQIRRRVDAIAPATPAPGRDDVAPAEDVEVNYGRDGELDAALDQLVRADGSVSATTRGTMRIPDRQAAAAWVQEQLAGRPVGAPGNRGLLKLQAELTRGRTAADITAERDLDAQIAADAAARRAARPPLVTPRLDRGFRDREDPFPGTNAEKDVEIARLRAEIDQARRRTGVTGASTLQRRIELQDRIDAIDAHRGGGDDQGGLFDAPAAAARPDAGEVDLDRDYLTDYDEPTDNIDALLRGPGAQRTDREDRLYELLGRIGVAPDERDRVMDQLIAREVAPGELVRAQQARYGAEDTRNDVPVGQYLVNADPADKADTLFEQRPAHALALARETPAEESGEVADALVLVSRGVDFEDDFAPVIAVLRDKQRRYEELSRPDDEPAAPAAAGGDDRQFGPPVFVLDQYAINGQAEVGSPAFPAGDYPTLSAQQLRPGDRVMFNRNDGGVVLDVRGPVRGLYEVDYQGVNHRPTMRRLRPGSELPVLNAAQPDADERQDVTVPDSPTIPAPTMAEQDGADLGGPSPEDAQRARLGLPPARPDVDEQRRRRAAELGPEITEPPVDDRTDAERAADDAADDAYMSGAPMASGPPRGAPAEDADQVGGPAEDAGPAEDPAPAGGGEVLDDETIETIAQIEADALGLVEGDDGELEVTDDVAARQDRIEAVLDRASRGDLDITALADSELGDNRRDAVEELRLQEAIARRDRERARQRAAERRTGGAVAANPITAARADATVTDDTDTAAGAAAETVPPTPAGPKRRPGLAGALEDLADAMDNGLDPDAVAAGRRRARNALARSRGDSEQHRQLAAELDRLDTPGEIANPDRLRELATALREGARTRRNSQARSRRLAKRLERERLRSLIGSYDAEIRNRGQNPDDFGGTPPAPIDAPDGPAGQEGGPDGADPDPGSGPAGQAEQAPARSAVDSLPPSFDRSDPDGPDGQARTTALVDGLAMQPWRLYASPTEAFGSSDPEQMERVKAAAREAYGPVLDRFGPMARRRTNADHAAAADTAAQKRAGMADPSKGGDAAAMTFAYLLPREARRDYVEAIGAATRLFREKAKPPTPAAADGPRRPAGVEVTRQRNGRLQVRSPKDDRFIAGVKALGGAKWDRYRTAWTVPASTAEALDELIEKVYGGDQGGSGGAGEVAAPRGDVVFLSDLPDGVVVRSNGTDMMVRSPYSDGFRLGARDIGGRWDRAERGWRFPESSHDQVIALVHRVYGTTSGRPPGPGDANPGAGQRPSEADVELASRLIERIGVDGYRHLTDRQWEVPPSAEALRQWPATDVSALLSKLRLMTRSS